MTFSQQMLQDPSVLNTFVYESDNIGIEVDQGGEAKFGWKDKVILEECSFFNFSHSIL